MRPTRAARLAVPVLAAGLALSALAACGSKAAPSASPSGSASAPTASDTPAPTPTTWPLTGLPAPNGTSLTTHPVYIAKIDNTVDSDPQYGISNADLVTEELVEGGITRLAVFFYSTLPQKAGPIRSMRLTDINLAKPLHAQLVTSGAAAVTLSGLHKAGIKYDDMSNPNVRRVLDGTHDTLHSVVANLKQLGTDAHQKSARPKDFLDWGTDADYPGTKAATTIDARFSSARVDHWSYAGGKYTLTDGYMAKGDVYSPDTIVAATVTTSLASYTDPAGNPVPVTHLTGSGKAYVFHGGKVVKATWHKKSTSDTIHFTLADGSALKIPAGHIWLELIPKGGQAVGAGSVTWKK